MKIILILIGVYILLKCVAYVLLQIEHHKKHQEFIKNLNNYGNNNRKTEKNKRNNKESRKHGK